MEDSIKNLGKVCITPEGVWDVNKEYDRLSLVVTTDAATQKVLSYVSRQHVPKGNISIDNTEYWQLFTTELKLEDITIDENGNVKIGDVVIYQIPLGDALGEIVVDKIKTDLTNHIMTEIRSYMNTMVQELISSFSNQIGRLIDNGFEIRNRLSGEVNAKHSGTINVNVNGNSESDDDEFIFTTDTPNINITSSSQWKQIYVNSEQNETPVEFSALHFPNWVEVLTIPSNPTVSSLVNIKFKENTDENSRGDNIILQQNGSNKTLTIHVIQQGTSSEPVNTDDPVDPSDPYVFTANSNTVNFNGAGTSNVVVTSTKNGSSIGYTASSADNWASFNNGVVTVLANDTPASRSTTITLTQNESNKTITITVNQVAGEFYQLDIGRDPDSNLPQLLNISINGRPLQSATFAAGTYVVVRVSAEGYLENVRGFNIYDHVSLVVTDNESIQGDNFIHLIQDPGYTYVLQAQNTQINLNSDVTSVQIPVTSTRDGAFIGYTARALNNASWITAINVPVDDNTPLTITLAPNNGNTARSETIVLDQNESYNVTQIYITQAASSSGGSGGDEPGGDEPGGGGSGDSDVYVFEATPNIVSFEAGLNLTKTINVVSTKNGNYIEFTRNGISNWLTAFINNGVVTITAEPNPSNESRTGYVRFLQVNGSSTVLTVNITQTGYEALPSGYEFAHMLDNNGENMTEVSFNSTDPISFNSSTNYRTLTTILKENGTISNDAPTIVYNGYPANAADTTTFTVNKNQNTLVFQVPNKPSTGVSTTYEFVVLYGNYGAKRNITLAYIPS